MKNLIKFFAAMLFAALIVITLHSIVRHQERTQAKQSTMTETNFNQYFRIVPGMKWRYEVTIEHDAVSQHVLTNSQNSQARITWRHIMRRSKPTNIVAFTVMKMIPSQAPITLYEMRVDEDDIGYFSHCAENRFLLELMESGTNFSAAFLFPIELESKTEGMGQPRHIIFVPPGAEATNPDQGEISAFERRDKEMLMMSRTVGPHVSDPLLGPRGPIGHIELPFRESMIFQPGVGMTHLEQHVQIPGQPPLMTMSWKLVDFK